MTAPSALRRPRSAVSARRGRRARAIRRDGGELLGLGPVGIQDRRRRAPRASALDAGIVLPGDRRVERSDGALASRRLAARFGGGAARRRVRGCIRVSEPRAAETPRSLLLTLILVDVGRAGLAGRLAGERVGEREAVGRYLRDEDRLVGLADIEVAGGESLE